MTRKKKSRSLSRIHNVKTGSISKFKKDAGSDRQTGKRVKKRTPSAYEKFLAENPEAKEQARQEQQKAATDNKRQASAKQEKPAEKKPEREKGLLDQLDSKDFDDIY